MSKGSQPRHTPVRPSRCNQQPVTKKGGSPSASAPAPIHHLRQRHSSPLINSAAKKPIATANKAVSALTNRLLPSSVQFIAGKSSSNSRCSSRGPPAVCPNPAGGCLAAPRSKTHPPVHEQRPVSPPRSCAGGN